MVESLFLGGVDYSTLVIIFQEQPICQVVQQRRRNVLLSIAAILTQATDKHEA